MLLNWRLITLTKKCITTVFTKQVADFGLSRQDRSKLRSSNIRGTYGYVDPEYVLTKTYTKKCDVYSFGVLLFEIITGRNPQQGLMEYVELVRTVSCSFGYLAFTFTKVALSFISINNNNNNSVTFTFDEFSC